MPDWLVLTGGAGSRLGQDKATTEVRGRTLEERVCAAIAEVDSSGQVTLVGPERSGGPAAAIAASVPETSDDFVGIVAVDMPFAGMALERLLSLSNETSADDVDVFVPVDDTGRRQWLCGLYRRSALIRRSERQDWIDQPFHRFVDGLRVLEVTVDERTSLMDVDTPEDLQRAEDVARLHEEGKAYG